MTADATIKLGPVLSFRGITELPSHRLWRVTALIGIASDAPAPTMTVEGKACSAPAQLHVHKGLQVLRYDLSVALGDEERVVEYSLADGTRWRFTVPAKTILPRMAYVSCNGFSDPAGMRKLIRPANAVWEDLLCNHDKQMRPADYLLDKEQIWHEQRLHDQGLQRFHVLLMGGDQLYFDAIWEDLQPLKDWVGLSHQDQIDFKVSAALKRQIEDYYYGLYAPRWLPLKRGAWNAKRKALDSADAMASMPTVMMWDDHDIFDGWGSYSPAMQQCEVFQTIFGCARRAYWVFQLQQTLTDLPELEDAYDGRVSKADPQFKPVRWSQRLAADPLALPFLDDQPGFSFAYQLGQIALLVPDLRTERSQKQILGGSTWQALQKWMNQLRGARQTPRDASTCEHLLLMSSVPVAHPKLSAAEAALDIFGQESVIDSNADDLRDHWAHGDHEGERKRLIETLCDLASDKRLRIEILSGDVHVAAWGTIHRDNVSATANWAQLQQFTSSAVVHPSLTTVFERLFFTWLNRAAAERQTIDVDHHVEMMMFPGYNQYIMTARNWLAVEASVDDASGRPSLWATWRCEQPASFSNHLYAVKPAKDD